MNWRIELVESDGEMPIVTVLQAHRIWKRLSKAAQESVEAAYDPDHQGVVDAHGNTLASLERHGFIHSDCRLTDAGRAVARWCVNP
jgi:hypothetical protein